MLATPNAQGISTRFRESLVWIGKNPDAAAIVAVILTSAVVAGIRIVKTLNTNRASIADGKEHMVNLQGLIDARDKLNADINAMIAAANIDQNSVDRIADEARTLDNDVLAVLTSAPPPSTVNFDAFNIAVNKLTENFKTLPTLATITQSTVDNLTTQMETLNSAFLAALGIV